VPVLICYARDLVSSLYRSSLGREKPQGTSRGFSSAGPADYYSVVARAVSRLPGKTD
jgi:hypothetical protein